MPEQFQPVLDSKGKAFEEANNLRYVGGDILTLLGEIDRLYCEGVRTERIKYGLLRQALPATSFPDY